MFKKSDAKLKKRTRIFMSVQILIAVTILLLVSYTFISFYRISKEDAFAIGEKAVFEVSEKLNNFILNGISVLTISSDTVDFMIQEGASVESINKYLTSMTEKYKKNTNATFTGIYGWVNNQYLDGSGWIPNEGYVPKARNWYLSAIRAKGSPVIIFPYTDADTGGVVISISRMLSDYSSVISIDISVDDMQKFAKDISLGGEGYGFIFDKNSMVVAHTDENERGKNILKDENISDDIKSLVGRIIAYGNDKQPMNDSRNFELDIDGRNCAAFSKCVMNDWYVVMIINNDQLFKKIQSNFVLNIIVLVLLIGFVVYFCTQIFMGNLKMEVKIERQTRKIQRQAETMFEMQNSIIEELATLIEDRDANTGEHVKNTKVYSVMIAKQLYIKRLHPEILTNTFIKQLNHAAPLHDVGKISVPDSILLSPKRLTDFEYETMKNHTIMGGAIIRRMFRKSVDKESVQMAVEVAQYHHERWDGKGYPLGMSGEDIPLCARILAVADCFDALVSERVYKKAFPPEEAFKMIEEESGTHFDPEIVEVFLTLKPKILEHLQHLKK